MAVKARATTKSRLPGTNLSRAGDYNQRVVLQAIRANGPVTRGDVAEITGLTHQSVINISRRLLDAGVIVDEDPIPGARGQPAARMAVNANGAYAIGLNIDREHITFVLMDLAGRVRRRIYTGQHFALPEQVLSFVEDQLAEIFNQRVAPRKRVIGLGIAIPEKLAGVHVNERPESYEAWSGLNVTEAFAERLGIPVYVENDATSAALGELQFGLGMTHQTFVYTLISAGIGSGLIINGQPYTGGLGSPGDLGKIPVRSNDGRAKLLWDVLSLFAFYEELARHGVTVSDVSDLREDDPATRAGVNAWIEMAAECLFDPCLTINYVLSPELHVIGGQLPAFVTRRLCDRLNARMEVESIVPLAPFCPSTVSVDAAAIGAAVVVFQNRLLPTPEALMK
ncbi:MULTISPECIES: ROK family transcriptional regulator [Asticcacaulis]|uniref:ROK family transcriptional regulator n=1 Tax=Asticcacaulis TaxID=76890 RepID=UPI001AE927C6|nr:MULTISPECIES: ROK family transcriptional regulator [Asticcacaulis]MBP2161016.1 putative NBD/HSP70 family sugar kinase [Asticcacaulis solisilvae]MDR6802061.1 putative NBD/HSP70 family sugar kinase [Asticcacaulis sp. BE141]